TAQIGACRIGVQRVAEVCDKYGLEHVERNVAGLLNHSEQLMRVELEQLPEGEFSAEDFLDNDGITDQPVKIRVMIKTVPKSGELIVDFTESAQQVTGSLNAVAAITYSATFYVLRCLLPEEAAAT